MSAYTYSDVLIKPKYSEIKTRTDVDLSSKIGHHTLKLPVISSNMKDITGHKMVTEVGLQGALGCFHRFSSVEESLRDFQDAHYALSVARKQDNIGVSIGVQEQDKERFEKLFEAGARVFCIDVAHGHHAHVKNMLRWINNQFTGWARFERGQVTLIAGNIATPEAYADMCEWGADAVKVGIGPSPVCRTRYNTGVGVPQLYALESIHKESMSVDKPISIIADGGISHVGDIAKALKYADAVMLGSMFAGTSETPGNVFRSGDGEFYKVYGGSASGENKGENRFVEGVIKTAKFRGHVKYILREIEQGLQSAFSYVGANNLYEYQNNCEFVHISGGARGESKI